MNPTTQNLRTKRNLIAAFVVIAFSTALALKEACDPSATSASASASAEAAQ